MVEQFKSTLQKCDLGKEGLGLANFEQLYETSILMVSEVKVCMKIVRTRIFCEMHHFVYTLKNSYFAAIKLQPVITITLMTDLLPLS